MAIGYRCCLTCHMHFSYATSKCRPENDLKPSITGIRQRSESLPCGIALLIGHTSNTNAARVAEGGEYGCTLN
jgi:hypothetical protein